MSGQKKTSLSPAQINDQLQEIMNKTALAENYRLEAETVKTYEYKILNRTFQDPSRRLYTMFWHYPLDVEKMILVSGDISLS